MSHTYNSRAALSSNSVYQFSIMVQENAKMQSFIRFPTMHQRPYFWVYSRLRCAILNGTKTWTFGVCSTSTSIFTTAFLQFNDYNTDTRPSVLRSLLWPEFEDGQHVWTIRIGSQELEAVQKQEACWKKLLWKLVKMISLWQRRVEEFELWLKEIKTGGEDIEERSRREGDNNNKRCW